MPHALVIQVAKNLVETRGEENPARVAPEETARGSVHLVTRPHGHEFLRRLSPLAFLYCTRFFSQLHVPCVSFACTLRERFTTSFVHAPLILLTPLGTSHFPQELLSTTGGGDLVFSRYFPPPNG